MWPVNQAISVIIGVLSTIAAIISIVTVFPSNLSTEQQIQLVIGILGWILAICFYIAYVISLKKHTIQASKHKADLKAIKAQHAIEKTALERDLAKGYESFLFSELGKTSTALVYTSQLLNPTAPIPKAAMEPENKKGKNDEF